MTVVQQDSPPDSGFVMPLTGVTVLDFSQFLAGPACALRLGDLGARVIKVERPDGGDASRNLYLADLAFDRDSALFHAINRGKLSVAADLKDARSEEHTSELQSLMRISYAVFCLKNNTKTKTNNTETAYE